MIASFDEEHKIRIAGSCAFDDWLGVDEANEGEALTAAVLYDGYFIVLIVGCLVFLSSFNSSGWCCLIRNIKSGSPAVVRFDEWIGVHEANARVLLFSKTSRNFKFHSKLYFVFSDFIEQKPGVLGGKPVIKGTQIGVDLILERIGAGETMEDIVNAYPFLNNQSILACISYGAASVRNETLLDVE